MGKSTRRRKTKYWVDDKGYVKARFVDGKKSQRADEDMLDRRFGKGFILDIDISDKADVIKELWAEHTK